MKNISYRGRKRAELLADALAEHTERRGTAEVVTLPLDENIGWVWEVLEAIHTHAHMDEITGQTANAVDAVARVIAEGKSDFFAETYCIGGAEKYPFGLLLSQALADAMDYWAHLDEERFDAMFKKVRRVGDPIETLLDVYAEELEAWAESVAWVCENKPGLFPSERGSHY